MEREVTNPFNWKSQPLAEGFRKQDGNHRRQLGTSWAAWKRGKQGTYSVRPIDQALHGGAYSKAKAA